MNDNFFLDRFVKAQKDDFVAALSEIKRGRKTSHWMWYIFPQLAGLGFSETSRHYAIKSLEEAKAYLEHPLLGERLLLITNELLTLTETNVTRIFGSPDDKKLQSCMTLFSLVPNTNDLFQKVLDKYFSGKKDPLTIELLSDTA